MVWFGELGGDAAFQERDRVHFPLVTRYFFGNIAKFSAGQADEREDRR